MENLPASGMLFIENNKEQENDNAPNKITQHKSSNNLPEMKIEKLPRPDGVHRVIGISLYGLNKLLALGYPPLQFYRLFEKSVKCAPVSEPILRISASELAKMIREKQVTSEEVIRKYVARIKEVNPLLNAVIDERYEDAIQEAIQVDKLISSDEFDKYKTAVEFPLLGLPLTVKGSFAVKGMLHTSGSVSRSEVIGEEDAEVVKQARNAGAIPLLVSNTPELCMNWETTNKLIGTTRNPHDSTRTCGGSSGGEASLLASAASLIGIGSDIAGSLRLPAHCCGVWSHKPSPRTVSDIGHYPNCSSRQAWENVFAVGPMTRYAKDLRYLLQSISKPDELHKLKLSEKVDVKNIKVFFADKFEDKVCDRTNVECSKAVVKVVDHFKNISSHQPKKIHDDLLYCAGYIASVSLLSIENIDNIFDGDKNILGEFFRFFTRRSKHDFLTISYSTASRCVMGFPDSYKDKVVAGLELIRENLNKLLGDDGVLVLPTYHMESFKHGDALKNMINSGYMSIFNALGFPVTTCPISVTKNGLPVGVQVVGLPYSDKLTLAIAEELECAFGGWIEPK
ncbi:fatty-acid amide hydrolase 2-like isoform X1 [Rhynchophorus ferrugineus]|uniref:fatty-acid amide hydrolase 2-like isoform X1 n=1 Tax=Rhynchophorus ferrugineus TaxID=354439 RepID=UPI003FCD389C